MTKKILELAPLSKTFFCNQLENYSRMNIDLIAKLIDDFPETIILTLRYEKDIYAEWQSDAIDKNLSETLYKDILSQFFLQGYNFVLLYQSDHMEDKPINRYRKIYLNDALNSLDECVNNNGELCQQWKDFYEKEILIQDNNLVHYAFAKNMPYEYLQNYFQITRKQTKFGNFSFFITQRNEIWSVNKIIELIQSRTQVHDFWLNKRLSEDDITVLISAGMSSYSNSIHLIGHKKHFMSFDYLL